MEVGKGSEDFIPLGVRGPKFEGVELLAGTQALLISSALRPCDRKMPHKPAHLIVYSQKI